MSNFSFGVLGQACYLIVSVPDLCLLPYFISYKQTILNICHTLVFSKIREDIAKLSVAAVVIGALWVN